MQSNLVSIVRERRGHDRVQDAAYLQVAPRTAQQRTALPNINTDEPNRKVSLSAGGIAFADNYFYQPGTKLYMRLVLFPSKLLIDCQATIVSVGDATEVATGDLPTYRARFDNLSSAQLQGLTTHIDLLLSGLRLAA